MTGATGSPTQVAEQHGAPSGAKRRVLFLCTGNSARSQMAEALLRAVGGQWFEVFSAGTQPKREIHPMAVEVMRELGITLAGQYPKDLRQYLDQHFDVIITVCDRARDACPVFPGDHEQIHWSFPDPTAAPRDEQAHAFRTVRSEMQTRIRLFIAAQTQARV